jgi:hypothetical protein
MNKKRLKKAASMVQEKRAKKQASGAPTAGAPTAGAQAPDRSVSAAPTDGSAGPSQDAMEKLKELGQLHDQGILTDEEFATQKAKILSG